MREYFGKYRGKVEENVDPHSQGRIRVSVPAVTGEGVFNWALPSTPVAGNGVGLVAIPPVGANVWVEYEAGNPDYPIWSGCFWGVGEVPLPSAAAGTPDRVVVLKTSSCILTVSDLPGPLAGVTVELDTGMKITMSADALEITSGPGAEIKLMGPTITVNGRVLEVD